uniref:Methenyltetrahydrofolate synthase domain-containing protein n=1 Tax=Arion vulgaris TaxID=1028688 RepID=A0A0B7B2U2_9EUPU
MENNNAIEAHGPDDEAKVDEESGNKERGSRQRRQPYNREVRSEDEVGKWAIRRKIWDYLEDNNLVNAPRPCHYRIPNFEGAAVANDKLANLSVFKQAKTVKVNPDKPQEQARFLVLQAGKELVLLNQSQRYPLSSSPTTQKQSGLLIEVVPPEDADNEKLRHCCTSQGVKEFSTEINSEDKVKIDLLIVGSVAVSRNGFRIGKGKGFADLEYSMMRTFGAIDANTVVVTSVHDSQIVDIPDELVGEHDLTVDYILTPTEVIETKCARPKPSGVIWNHLEVNKFFQIPVLRQLRELEREAGSNVLLKGQGAEEDDPLDNAEPPRPRRFRRFGRGGGGGGGYRGRGRPFSRYRRGGGGGRRRTDGDDNNRENTETGDESGADGDNDGQGRRRNYRNRRFNSRGKPRAYESEHSDGGGESGQGDGEDKAGQRRYPSRRRFQRRRQYDGGSRRDNRGGGDHSGSDGEQKTSGDEDGEGRRPQRQRFRTNANTIVWVGGLSRRLRVSELKTELRALHVNPLRLVWRGARGFAFIHFQTTDSAKEAVSALAGKELDGKEIKVEMANNDRPPRRWGADYHGSNRDDHPSSDQGEVGDR